MGTVVGMDLSTRTALDMCRQLYVCSNTAFGNKKSKLFRSCILGLFPPRRLRRLFVFRDAPVIFETVVRIAAARLAISTPYPQLTVPGIGQDRYYCDWIG